jgi:hypothetical protein
MPTITLTTKTLRPGESLAAWLCRVTGRSAAQAVKDRDAAYINAEHAAGEKAVKKSLEHFLNAGRRLLKKKAEVTGGKYRGGWEKWVSSNLTFSIRTAQRYMRFAESVGSENETVSFSDLNLKELWASTRSSPPEEPAESEPAPAATPTESGSAGPERRELSRRPPVPKWTGGPVSGPAPRAPGRKQPPPPLRIHRPEGEEAQAPQQAKAPGGRVPEVTPPPQKVELFFTPTIRPSTSTGPKTWPPGYNWTTSPGCRSRRCAGCTRRCRVARRIICPPLMSDDEAAALEGTHLGASLFDHVVGEEDVDAYLPDGSPLFLLRHNALDPEACQRAYHALRPAATVSYNRGAAAGGGRYRAPRQDGTLSNTLVSEPALSGTIGFYPRTAREPFCRTTAFTWRRSRRWERALPFFRGIGRVFARELPDRHAAQMEAVRRTPEEYVIHRTAFTTITVNMNFPTAVHRDRGDLEAGFGAMSVFRAGDYDGCFLMFPQYGIAVDLTTRGRAALRRPPVARQHPLPDSRGAVREGVGHLLLPHEDDSLPGPGGRVEARPAPPPGAPVCSSPPSPYLSLFGPSGTRPGGLFRAPVFRLFPLPDLAT